MDFVTKEQRLNKNNKFKGTLHLILMTISIILIVDSIGYLAWAVSGQTPIDNWYLGAITNNLIN